MEHLIKQLQPKEGVTLLGVKWPEEASDLCMPKIGMVDLYFHNKSGVEEDYISVNIPSGPWQLLGIATEIPEEVWQGIMATVKRSVFGYTLDVYEDFKCPEASFNTATGSAMSFLEANKVYNVNPLGERPSIINHDVWYSEEDWKQAQANIGTWVILMKQND